MRQTRPLPNKIQRFFTRLSARLNRDYKYANNEGFKTFLIEVGGDLKVLRKIIELPKYERDKKREFLTVIHKYQRAYCPYIDHNLLSYENDFEFSLFRSEIDDIIKMSKEPSAYYP